MMIYILIACVRNGNEIINNSFPYAVTPIC